jgi:hypothetical protein
MSESMAPVVFNKQMLTESFRKLFEDRFSDEDGSCIYCHSSDKGKPEVIGQLKPDSSLAAGFRVYVSVKVSKVCCENLKNSIDFLWLGGKSLNDNSSNN